MEHQRIRALDGLRAFAIIMVLFAHSAWKFDYQITIKLGSAEFQNFFYNGWSGVDLFFVLSGFLISSQLLKTPLTRDNLRKFFGKRYFRIAPAYYISVILALILLHIIPALNDGFSIAELFTKWWQPFLAHISFLHDYVGRYPSIGGLFWSIPVEIKFYLILPLFIYLLLKINGNTNQIYAISGFYLLFLIAKFSYIYSAIGTDNINYMDYFMNIKTPFHFALDGLIIGVLCAFILRSKRLALIAPNSKILNIIFCSSILLFSALNLSPHFLGGVATFFESTIMTSMFAISFGAALIALVKGCVATKFFSNFILRFIATISYSMYLTHVYALYFQIAILDKLSEVISSPTLCWIISLPAFFAVAISLAYLLHIAIEKPFINWSRSRWS